jgi:hypothetical protein
MAAGVGDVAQGGKACPTFGGRPVEYWIGLFSTKQFPLRDQTV